MVSPIGDMHRYRDIFLIVQVLNEMYVRSPIQLNILNSDLVFFKQTGTGEKQKNGVEGLWR